MADKNLQRASSSSSRTSVIKSITSSGQERKSLEWVDSLLEESSKQESKSDYTSDTWAKIVASELTTVDVDEKIRQVEEELFGNKSKPKTREKKTKAKVVEEEDEEEDEEEGEEEDEEERRLFTLDLGRLDDHVADVLRLLAGVTYPSSPRSVPDSSTNRSIYTATRTNLNRLGLQVVLNRVAVAFEYKAIKPTRDFPTPSIKVNITSEAKSNIWDKLRAMKLSDALRTLAQRTDGIFGKELGPITGSLLVYPKHAILMLEGPELSLTDYFSQLDKSFVRQRIVKGKVLFIMPHVLIRYLDEWSDLEALPPETDHDMDASDPVRMKKLLAYFGKKCAYFWKYLRRKKLTGAGRSSGAVPPSILPEESLIEAVLESASLRSMLHWMHELTTLDVERQPPDESWPENDLTLPESSFKPDHYVDSLGITVKPTKLPPQITPDMDHFLTENKTLYEEAAAVEEAAAEEAAAAAAAEAAKQKEMKLAQGKEKSVKAKSSLWKSKKKKQAASK